MSTRLNLALGFLLVICALAQINAQYRARSLFIALERANNLSHQFELEWTQLKLDQSTFGKHARIESVATKELGMTAVPSGQTQYLSANANARSSAEPHP
ncbi:MAG: cell division protein FtsL [Undibacterium sp.]|nr:cell division protein FtsL [Undibacterium sp.]